MAAQPNAQAVEAKASTEPFRNLKHTGYCHNDAIRVDDGEIFCSPFCKGEWIKQHPA